MTTGSTGFEQKSYVMFTLLGYFDDKPAAVLNVLPPATVQGTKAAALLKE